MPVNIPNPSDRCECGDIFAAHIHGGIEGGHIFRPSLANKQRAIDISNLRFYSAMAHDFKWQTDIIHWGVISKTLQEIADRLASDETGQMAALEHGR